MLSRLPALALALFAAAALPALADEAPEGAPKGPEEEFLTSVEPLISEAERAAYLALTRSYQRQAFERRFWELRDPYPETPRNELEERFHERLRLARERFPLPGDERFRMFLLLGEPLRRIPLRCAEVLRPGEIWYVSPSDRIPQGFALVFLSRGVSAEAPHRLWSPRDGLAEILAWTLPPTSDLASELQDRVPRDCARGDEIAVALAAAADWNDLARRYEVVPRPNPEWVRTFLSYSTDLPEGATPLPATVEVHFAGRHQSRTIVDTAVLVETSVLASAAGPSGGAPSGTALLLDGEILRDGELFDHFRYRFELGPERLRSAASLPFSARRFLRPGTYTLVLRLQEPSTGRAFRSEIPLAVPSPAALTAPTVAAAPVAPPASGAEASALTPSSALARLDAAAANADKSPEPSLRLLAPLDQLTLGKVRVEADVRGIAAARVDFTLDGKPLLSKRRPPYSIEFDLGRSPRVRRLAASAFDESGAVVAADEVAFNAGPHRFAVRLTEPLHTPPSGAPLEVRAEIDVPEGEELDRVEFSLDDHRLATLYQPPFAVSLLAPEASGLTYLRAVAYLASGGTAEDVRLLGAEGSDEALEVDLVELFATVLDRRGQPVRDLVAGDFKVFEDDAEQTLQRFENVDTLPIHAGVMIDTSASMVEELEDAEAAAHRFFREVLTPADRAAVITFADAPRLAVRFTANLERLAGGLAGLEAQGETRFFDSLAFALHYFSGVRGKRALILLTDGDDSDSTFRFDEVLEYARRTGVTIYAIGLNVPSRPVDAGVHLDQLARETGGRSFRIHRANELASVYETIRMELRSQYLLAYQSSKLSGSTAYRTIRLETGRPGVTARTISGYYP